MAEYQNLFTQVQVQAPANPGVPLDRDRDTRERVTTHWHSSLMGCIGNDQIGTKYLGFLGVGGFKLRITLPLNLLTSTIYLNMTLFFLRFLEL